MGFKMSALLLCHLCQPFSDHLTQNCPKLICAECDENGHAKLHCPYLKPPVPPEPPELEKSETQNQEIHENISIDDDNIDVHSVSSVEDGELLGDDNQEFVDISSDFTYDSISENELQSDSIQIELEDISDKELPIDLKAKRKRKKKAKKKRQKKKSQSIPESNEKSNPDSKQDSEIQSVTNVGQLNQATILPLNASSNRSHV